MQRDRNPVLQDLVTGLLQMANSAAIS